MWASKFLAAFWEVRLYWQVKAFQIISMLNCANCLLQFKHVIPHAAISVDPLDIPTNGTIWQNSNSSITVF
jgi:hypothetical protein